MLILIVGAALGTFGGWMIGLWGKDAKGFAFGGCISGLLAALCIGLIIGCNTDVELREITSLVSLRNSEVSEGHLTLGCGSIAGVAYYYYFAGDSMTGYRQYRVPADDTPIFEEERTTGELWTFHNAVPARYDRWSIGPAILFRYEFHIPRGSIVRQFRLE